MNVKRIDVDYVVMLNHHVVRYRWNTEESDVWRKNMLPSESHKRWDHSAHRMSVLPDSVRKDAVQKLEQLMTRTKRSVMYDAPAKNIQLNDKQFHADMLVKSDV